MFTGGIRRGDGQVAITYAEPQPSSEPEPPEESEPPDEGNPPEHGGGAGEPPAPGPIVEPPAPRPPQLAVAIRSPRSHLANRVAKLKLACRGGAPRSVCRGVLRLSTGRVLLGGRRYAVASGETRRLAVRLRPASLRWLLRRRHRAARVRATATATGGRNSHRAIVLRLGAVRRHLHTPRGGAGSPLRK